MCLLFVRVDIVSSVYFCIGRFYRTVCVICVLVHATTVLVSCSTINECPNASLLACVFKGASPAECVLRRVTSMNCIDGRSGSSNVTLRCELFVCFCAI